MIYIGFDDENQIKERKYQNNLSDMKEKWKTIMIGGYASHYKISNTGKVKNMLNGNVIGCRDSESSNYKGRYINVSLTCHGEALNTEIHRLVALYFIPIPKRYTDMGLTVNDLVPNHKDGIKYHNAAFNLEWCTQKENRKHAFDTGLADSSMGENSHLAKMTEEQAIRCCQLLQDGWTTSDIAENVGVSKKSVQHIKSGECWVRVSKDFKFKRIGKAIPNTLTEDTIHLICKDLEKKEFSDSELGRKYGVSREYIRDIRNHKKRTNISKDYNF